MLRSGQIVVLCVLALLTLGVVMVNSAGMSVDPAQAVTEESILLSRSTVYMALAIAAMIACAMLPIRRVLPASWLAAAGSTPLETDPEGLIVSGEFGKGLFRAVLGLWPMWLLVLAMLGVLATVYLPGIGRTVNGSSRWISLPAPGLESIQPSELAKWAMVAILAWYGATNMHRLHRFWRGLLPGLVAGGALAGFIVLEDLGTGVLMGLVACLMLVAAGARIWQLAVLAPAPLTLIALAISSSQYRRDRLLAFLDPYADPDGIGYHMIQSMVAVANGEVAGRGLGHGLQKFGYLPEDRTDFLFAIICEELGVAGAMVVVALYAGMLWSCWTIIRREQSAMLKLLGLGVVATVGIQALINLAVVTGLGPTKGIALPLLSSGGTGWILTAASLGLIVAMDRTQDGWMPAKRIVPPRPIADALEDSAQPTPAALVEQSFEPRPVEMVTTNDDLRWAPPSLFEAASTAVLAPPISATEPYSASESDSSETGDVCIASGEQSLLFAADEPTHEPEPDAEDESASILTAPEEAESPEELAASEATGPETIVTTLEDDAVEANSVTLIESTDPIFASEVVVASDAPSEPLIVSFADDVETPAAAKPEIVVRPMTDLAAPERWV